MRVDDYEKQHERASVDALAEFAMPGDGTAICNAAVIMRLVDAFMALPCSAQDHHAARSLRRDWVEMKKSGEDWSKWSDRDLHRLLQALDTIVDIVATAHDIAAVHYVVRRLREK